MIRDPQYDSRPRGGSDAWDSPQASAVLAEDVFTSGATQSDGVATGTPAGITQTAPAASASGEGAAAGTPASLVLVPPTASASASGAAAGTPASLVLVPPTASASGGVVIDGVATGAPPAISLTAPAADADGGTASSDGEATGTPPHITLVAPAARTNRVEVRVYWAQLDTNVAENVIPPRRSRNLKKRKPHKDDDLLLFIGAL